MENSTFYAAQKILSQIGQESPDCLFWIFSGIDRMLKVNKEMSLYDFFKELQKLYPEDFENFVYLKEQKGFKIVE